MDDEPERGHDDDYREIRRGNATGDRSPDLAIDRLEVAFRDLLAGSAVDDADLRHVLIECDRTKEIEDALLVWARGWLDDQAEVHPDQVAQCIRAWQCWAIVTAFIESLHVNVGGSVSVRAPVIHPKRVLVVGFMRWHLTRGGGLP